MKTKLVEFTPPAGAVPEGTAVGEEFDLVSTFRVKKGGTVCLVVMGDQKMPGYEEKSTHDNYASEANAMRSGMMGGGGMAGGGGGY